MQFRNFFLLLLTGLFLFSISPVQAQKVITNERGEKIVTYPDGSWRYFDETENEARVSEKTKRQYDETERPSKKGKEGQIAKSDDRTAILIAERALAEENLAIEMEEDARFERVLLEEQLVAGKEDGSLNKKQVKNLETRIKIARKREKEATVNRKKISKAARKAEKDLQNNSGKAIVETTGNKKKDTSKITNKKSAKPDKSPYKNFAVYNEKQDVMINPPETGCKLSFDGKDDFSGKNRRVVEKQPFFSYTPEKLRAFVDDEDFIKCNAYLSSLSGGFKFLTLEITVASERAQKEYGIIEKESVLTVKLLNGDNVKLFNNKTDVGTLNSLDKTVSYTAQYIIPSGGEKLLRKNEVDKVRLIWSSGYEDYEVYELDFFIDQFKCLNKK